MLQLMIQVQIDFTSKNSFPYNTSKMQHEAVREVEVFFGGNLVLSQPGLVLSKK